MPLSPPPPRAFPPAAATRNPRSALTRGGGAWASLASSGYFDVLGRSGGPPTSQQDAWVWQSINNTPPYNAMGTWLLIGAWFRLIEGLADSGYDFNLFIEFRSPAEVATAAGPGEASPVYAITSYNNDPRFPPMDGTNIDGDLMADLGYDNPTDFRVLIRDDLQDGVGVYSGQAGFTEVLTHELGHVAMMLMAELYGSDWLVEQVCDIFGRPTSDWSAGPWGYRVVEGCAETLKDLSFPGRQHNNRTFRWLPHDRFDDFIQLFFDWGQTPYWHPETAMPLSYSDDPSAIFSGDAQPVIAGGPITLAFASDDYIAAHAYTGSLYRSRLPYRWPLEGDDLTVHWNFNVEPYAPSYNGRAWSDYDPGTEARVGFAARFYEIDYTQPSLKGALLDEWASAEVNPVLNAAGEGSMTVDVPAGLPDDGCVVELGFGLPAGGWQNPDPGPGALGGAILPNGDLYRYDGSGWVAHDGPMDYVTIWWEAADGLRVARWPVPSIAWPYEGVTPPVPGRVAVGPGRSKIGRPEQRFIQRLF